MKAMKNNLQLYSSSETHSFTSPPCDVHSNDDLEFSRRVKNSSSLTAALGV